MFLFKPKKKPYFYTKKNYIFILKKNSKKPHFKPKKKLLFFSTKPLVCAANWHPCARWKCARKTCHPCAAVRLASRRWTLRCAGARPSRVWWAALRKSTCFFSFGEKFQFRRKKWRFFGEFWYTFQWFFWCFFFG